MRCRSPWINLGLVGLAFVLYILIMFATSGDDGPATTEPPDPTILRVTADVAADEHAFDLQLALVVITDGVTEIGDRAFRDCMALTRVYFPESLESIGMGAFSGCNSLQFIVYAGTIEQWELVTKGAYWADGILAKEVVCSDGTVSVPTNDRE